MAQLLVRNLDPEAVRRLKARAQARGRSLQAEVRHILEQAARVEPGVFWEAADRLSAEIAAAGRPMSDSAELLREDRDR